MSGRSRLVQWEKIHVTVMVTWGGNGKFCWMYYE